MSKRAEDAALKAYPEKDALNKKATGHYDANYPRRKAYQQGYEQAEKDTIDAVSDWLRENIQDYLFMSNGEPHIAINGVIEIMRDTINEEE